MTFRNRERYGTRDLAYSGWHRHLPHPCRMLDLDHMEYCPDCYTILGLVEVTQGYDYPKHTTMLRTLATVISAGQGAVVSAYLVRYIKGEDGQVTEFWVLQQKPVFCDWGKVSPERFGEHLVGLHEIHDAQRHPARAAQPRQPTLHV